MSNNGRKQSNSPFEQLKKSKVPNGAVKPTPTPAAVDKPVTPPVAEAVVVDATPATSDAVNIERKPHDPIEPFKLATKAYCDALASGKHIDKRGVVKHSRDFYNALMTGLLHKEDTVALGVYKHLMDSMENDSNTALSYSQVFSAFDNNELWPAAKARREMECILNIALDCRVASTRGARARAMEWNAVPDQIQARNRDMIVRRLKASFGL